MKKKVLKKAYVFTVAALMLFSALFIFSCSSLPYEREPSIDELVQKRRTDVDEKNRQIIADLRKGGYVIFLRHAKTDWSQKDIEPFDFTACAGQRNLSEEGRRQAVKIGEAYRALGIPVASVMSSPFCRCRDTAELAFKTYTSKEDLQHIPYRGNKEGRKKMQYLWERLDEMLAQVPPPGQNIVLVGHSPNLIRRIDIRALPEGNSVIFKPDGEGSSELIGMILPEELFRLY